MENSGAAVGLFPVHHSSLSLPISPIVDLKSLERLSLKRNSHFWGCTVHCQGTRLFRTQLVWGRMAEPRPHRGRVLGGIFKNPRQTGRHSLEVDFLRKYFHPDIALARHGYSAAVFTQTTDVEGEINGFFTYDRQASLCHLSMIFHRRESKVPVELIREMNGNFIRNISMAS